MSNKKSEGQALQLLVWGPGYDCPSLDPDCLSVMAYLNLVNQPFSIVPCLNPDPSLHESLPTLKLADGSRISGPSAIIRCMQRQNGSIRDDHLTAEDQAKSLAYISLLQNTLYDALLYTWWIESENYFEQTRPTVSKNLSFIARYKIPQQLQDRAKERVGHYSFVKGANGQSESEVYVRARKAYRALSTLLGDKEYFFGSRPSTLDAIALGHLAVHAFPSLSQPKLFSILTFEAPNLIAYVARLKPQLIPTLESDLALQPSSTHIFQRGIKTFGALFQSESTSTPEERRDRFYDLFSVFGSFVVLGTFLRQSGLVSFGFDESTSERVDDDDA